MSTPGLAGLSLPARLIAGLLALLMVLALGWLLHGARLQAPEAQARRITVVMLKPSQPVSLREPAAAGQRQMRQPSQRGGDVQRPGTHAGVQTLSAPRADRPESSTTAPLPAAAAPSPVRPLDLGAGTVRSAMLGTKGAVQQLASASGQTLHSPRISASERLSTAVADSGIPYCLQADGLKHDPPQIGPLGVRGVLVAPFMVHAALTGKCKT